jgi:Holliday junction DNA helicase RuvB
VAEVCEPFLLRVGLLARTPRGRVATRRGWQHLGRTPPPTDATPVTDHAPGLFSLDP